VRIGFLFGLNIVFSIVTLLLYYSAHIPPSIFWPSTFLPLLIPLFIVINFIFLVFFVVKTSLKALLSLIVLIIGYSFILRTYAIHFNNMEEPGLRVLSYNVRIFNVYDHLRDTDSASSKNMIQWLKSNPAEILCLQEFYEYSPDSVFNTLGRISKEYPHYNYSPFFRNKNDNMKTGSSFGMIIFSKLPIINKGTLQGMPPFYKTSNNQVLYIDVRKGKDTIRIYNIHLQSMALEENEISMSGGWKRVAHKLKRGAISRSGQITVLNEHIKKCSVKKIIICGDLNDTPYSYSYETFKSNFNNSFEEAGNGFGFTYNGKLFLRIDNQFFSRNITVSSFKVHKEIKYSDHFPIEGIYSLN
jgi:endonuclease/exonuclease/phosphatase family metal-dependent hydrolase